VTAKSLSTALVNTVIKNDITSPHNTPIKLESIDAEYNGDFELVQGIDRNNFEITVDINATFPVIETITLVENDLTAFNNIFQVSEVVDVNNFKIVTYFEDTTDISGGEFYDLSKVRIVTDVDINRFSEAYTKQAIGKNYIVIISGGSTRSRSRKVDTDFEDRVESGNDIQIDTQDTFAVFIYVPCQTKVTPTEQQDFCRDDIKKALLKTFQGFSPLKQFSNSYDHIYYLSDDIFDYNTSVYIHQFNFACTLKLDRCDSYKPKSFAIRSIDTKFYKDEDLKAEDLFIF
jgi:hypothetical protein